MAEPKMSDVWRDTGALLEALDRADKPGIDSILAHADLRLVALSLGNAALGLARRSGMVGIIPRWIRRRMGCRGMSLCRGGRMGSLTSRSGWCGSVRRG